MCIRDRPHNEGNCFAVSFVIWLAVNNRDYLACDSVVFSLLQICSFRGLRRLLVNRRLSDLSDLLRSIRCFLTTAQAAVAITGLVRTFHKDCKAPADSANDGCEDIKYGAKDAFRFFFFFLFHLPALKCPERDKLIIAVRPGVKA